ncbi:hypothetical protein BO78DRAFT_193762 [Aspergillus sclerotiicarbonarius CBS 121057]|uniref:Uncharacterized protein n=1 Tax=Aspergillus sclerotiicarbonarius (strain CBS 121057 / IBT 28362) TaxID=1448318 RepID=A0A319E2I6_ASPSB|nr:hypothetical protein BO78DRAFT_193762 [Aspergillus sclerotiicarbonarius CBS 121057]
MSGVTGFVTSRFHPRGQPAPSTKAKDYEAFWSQKSSPTIVRSTEGPRKCDHKLSTLNFLGEQQKPPKDPENRQ